MELLIKLLLAHFLCDFIFQPDRWIDEKNEKRLKSFKLYLHSFIYGLFAWLLVFDIKFWKLAVILIISHLVIDFMKVIFQRETTKRSWFLADQLLHLLVLAIVWFYSARKSVNIWLVWNINNLIILTMLVFITKPASVIIRTVISRWAPSMESDVSVSLEHAGEYIGILERFIAFIFILLNHWEGVGFLITAKSVFRFGDIKNASDRKMTEYFLIGSLLSYGLAILSGIIAKWLLSMSNILAT
jgi:hypothetical protein